MIKPNQLGRRAFPASASQWMLVGLRSTGPATGYSLNGPEGGEAGVPSTNFTVQLTGGTTVPLPVTITPADGGGGGTFTPSTVILDTGSTSATFTYTPASSGVKTISTTNDRALPNPSSLGYIATGGVHLLNTLISYWKLDEASTGVGAVNRNDSQGTNHLVEFSAFIASAAGKISNGLSCSGGAACIRIADNSTLRVTSDFTFSMWVKLNAQTGAFMLQKQDVPGVDYGIQYTAGNGFEAYVANGGSTPGVNSVKTGVATSNGVWSHIVWWYDSGTGQLYLRFNDTTTYQTSACPVLIQTTSGFSIGAAYNATLPVNAVIDEVGFWKRKLTLLEITQLYNSGAGLAFASFTA